MDSTSRTTRSRKVAVRWLAGAVLIAALFGAARVLPVGAWLEAVNAWVRQHGLLGGVVYVLLYALCTILLVPGSALTIAAGLIFGLLWGTVVVSFGSTLGAAGAFLIARYFARERVERAARGNPKFQAIDRAIGQRGWKIVALLRLNPVIPYSLSNYLYGLTAVRFWPYVTASLVAMLPATVLYVYLGTAGGAMLRAASGEGSKSDPLRMGYFVVGLIATVVATVYLTGMARRALAQVDAVGASETEHEHEQGHRGASSDRGDSFGRSGALLVLLIAGLLAAGVPVRFADGRSLHGRWAPDESPPGTLTTNAGTSRPSTAATSPRCSINSTSVPAATGRRITTA